MVLDLWAKGIILLIRIIVEIAKGGRGDRGGDRRDDDRRRDDRGGDRRERRRSPIRKPDHRIQVLGLPSQTSWQDLKDLMRKAGEVQYTNVLRSGDGIVEFINIEDKEKAMDMFQNYDYNGNTLTIKEVICTD
jgi:splicing factor, arginine/serine-rich 4/5/6